LDHNNIVNRSSRSQEGVAPVRKCIVKPDPGAKNQKSEARNQKPETRSQMPGARCQEPDARSQEVYPRSQIQAISQPVTRSHTAEFRAIITRKKKSKARTGKLYVVLGKYLYKPLGVQCQKLKKGPKEEAFIEEAKSP